MSIETALRTALRLASAPAPCAPLLEVLSETLNEIDSLERDAACWRYFLENHRYQIAAALNCSEYDIEDRLRDVVPG